MKTYSIKEQDEFRSKNRGSSEVFAEFCRRNGYLDWPDGFDFVSRVELNEDQIVIIRRMLKAMQKFQFALKELHAILPEGSYTQIFGNWNLLKIGIVEKELEERD